MDKNKTCLLITGCIEPNYSIPTLAVKDPYTRRVQYRESLLFYINKSQFSKIVFCENSGAIIDKDILDIAQNSNKKFEWISFNGDINEATKRGKGYGEGEIIKYALNNSSILLESISFVKVTGRLYAKNIDSCLNSLSNNCSYFDFHKGFVDTRCYVAKIEEYKNTLLNAYKEVNDLENDYLEKVIYRKIYNLKQYKQIPFYINIVGQSGSTGEVIVDPPDLIRMCKTAKRKIISLHRSIF